MPSAGISAGLIEHAREVHVGVGHVLRHRGNRQGAPYFGSDKRHGGPRNGGPLRDVRIETGSQAEPEQPVAQDGPLMRGQRHERLTGQFRHLDFAL